MSFGQWVFGQKRLFILMTVLLTILGVMSLLAVPKDEDPRLPEWFAAVSVVLPGGEASQIDEMIARPLNEKFKEIDEIKKIDTTTRANITVLQIEMKDSVRNTKEVWDKVRNAVRDIKKDFPEGTLEPEILENTNRLETILYVVSGEKDLVELKAKAVELKRQLLTVSGVSTVLLHGDPKEEIEVLLDQQKIEKMAVPHVQIYQKLAQAGAGRPAGSIEIQGQKIPILIPSRIESAAQVQELRVMRGSGETVPLKELARIDKKPRRLESRAHFNGEPAIYLGVVAQHPIEIVDFGAKIRSKVQSLIKLPEYQGTQIQEVSFNPDRTRERLADLGTNLLIGILTVAVVLLFWMGWRVALIVSIFVPVISLVGFFVYSAGGGVLHQISLAAFVISLGQFIDNIIVIVEWMDGKIRSGVSALSAATQAVDNFKKPMFFATGTNISAFLPMMASRGTTAEFTVAIPVVSIVTMLAALVLALCVVPIISAYLLDQKNQNQDMAQVGSKKINPMAMMVANRPGVFALASFVIMFLSSVGFLYVKKQFFPLADRNQLVVQLDLKEGATADETLKQALTLTEFIKARPEVSNVASFVGEEIPRFYYNVGLGDWGQHTARLLVTTKEKKLNLAVISDIEKFAAANLKEAFVLSRNLEQGPPLVAPVEIKIFHEDEKTLLSAAQELSLAVAKNQNLDGVKNDIGHPIRKIRVDLDRDLAEKFGLSEDQMALTLLSSTSGVPAAKFFEQGVAKDVKLIGEPLGSLEDLKNLHVRASAYRSLRLRDLAKIQFESSAGVIHRQNGLKLARVLAWPNSSTTTQEILAKSSLAIEATKANHQVEITLGGEVEGSQDASMAILMSVPMGLFVLILCLLLEFNSFRKMSIVLLSVPFVMAGVTPGLLLGKAAFGFMSLLGVLALIGIVVNNSILLIESIDESLDEGLGLVEAVGMALTTRTRPILMTAVTTIVGLLPMAFEESTLWPPLAWAMISGLIGSTLITLVLVPSLYVLSFQKYSFQFGFFRASRTFGVLLVGLLGGVWGFQAKARTYGFHEAISEAKKQSPLVQSASGEAESLQALSRAQTQNAFLPKVGLQVESKNQLKDLSQSNVFGTFTYGKRNQVLGAVELSQPLFDLSRMNSDRNKMKQLVAATQSQKRSSEQEVGYQVAKNLIALARISVSLESMKRLEKSLIGIEKEVAKFQKQGLRGQSDLLSVELALSENRTRQFSLRESQQAIIKSVQIHLPDFDGALLDKVVMSENQDKPREISAISTEDQNPGLLAMDSKFEAIKSDLSSARQGHLPTLEFKARYLYADQGLLDQKDWTETSLVLTWALFEGGTRQSLVQSKTAEAIKVQQDKIRLKRELAAGQAANLAETATLEYRQKEARLNLVRAEKALAEDRQNARVGRVPLKDWLGSEIRVEEKNLELETLRLDKLELNMQRKYLVGESI